MNVEIINVGTELLLGEIVNTNASLLLKMCKRLGFTVYYQSVVGDNVQRLYHMLDLAFQKGADCVITTGGLGPTEDDLTKAISAKYLGLDMVYMEEEAQKIYDKCCFLNPSKVISPSNFQQAYFPKESWIIENRIGTANGCIMEKNHKMIINLPGPPKELQWCLEHVVEPYLEKYRQAHLYTLNIDTMGIGESAMADLLQDLIGQQKDISIAIYAHEDHNRIRLGCQSMYEKDALMQMQPLKQEIEHRLASYIIDYEHIYKMVFQRLNPLKVYYLSSFEMDASFFDQPGLRNKILGIEHVENKQEMIAECYLAFDVNHQTLGDIVEIDYHAQKQDHHLSVPLLYDASLSLKKLEGKLVMMLYHILCDGEG